MNKISFIGFFTLLVFGKINAGNITELGKTNKIVLYQIGHLFDTTATVGFRFKADEFRRLDVFVRGWATNQDGDYGKVYDKRNVWGIWISYQFYSATHGNSMESAIKVVHGGEDEKLLLDLIKAAENECFIAIVKERLGLLGEVIKTRNPIIRDKLVSMDNNLLNRILKSDNLTKVGEQMK
jgi:hypothetical protein